MSGLGSMRDLVVFQQATRTEVEGGGGITTWADVKKTWAKVTPASAAGVQRQIQDSQIVLKEPIDVLTRVDPGIPIDKSMRLIFRSNDYSIISVVEVEDRGRYYKLIATRNG